ncbi:MAG: hypothetical protein AAGK97_10630, partial [Bacteroidota bacterium]
MGLSSKYLERASTFQKEANELETLSGKYSVARLIYFLVGLGIIILSFQFNILLGIALIVLFLLSFYALIQKHLRIQFDMRQKKRLAKVNQLEAAVLQNHDFSYYNNGSIYADTAHPYSDDLDLFGPKSLFQYLNRCNSLLGRDVLANALLSPVNKLQLTPIQNAIKELKDKLDWRQSFQAFGMDVNDKKGDLDNLSKWLDEPNFMLNNLLLKVAVILVPLIDLAL